MIQLLTRVTHDDVEAINCLIPQLTERGHAVTADDLRDVIEHADLLVYRDNRGVIRGMMTLITAPKLLGREGRVEDVVVDASCRGNGVGRALMDALLLRAQELHLRMVHLTSHPRREAANRLYLRCGFLRHESNVYYLPLRDS
ncbi:MAG: GNAT family N-acetyltransferase [Patescibacteria group bacterium]|nr:MAG: GNAT family N-acetyltransferase [Patescibacteria group bacterium]